MLDNEFKKISPNHLYLFIALLSACFFLWLQSRYCSLHPGRDMTTYWSYYRDFFRIHPESRILMLFRTPVTPLFFGMLFDLFGSPGVQVVLSVLYVFCLLTVYAIGSRLSGWVGLLALILLGGDIQYYYWFFSVGSESPQSFLLVLWMGYAFFTFRKVEPRYWVVHAVLVWLLILNRPGNQVMVLCALFPLFNVSQNWKRRIILLLVFLFSYGACHVGYASFNYTRVGGFRVTTMGNTLMPFYRLYLQDGLISPDNGIKSKELAQMVEEKILILDVYKQYRIDKEIFFTRPSQRMYNQLVRTVGEVYGWEAQWVILRQVALEAFFKHPVEFFLTYIDHVRNVFYVRGNGKYDISPYNRSKPDYASFLQQRYKLYEQSGLPIPSEGDLLPGPEPGTANNVQEDYTSQTFFQAKKHPVAWTFPEKHCSYHWGDLFDIYGLKFPFTFMFICLGITGVALSLLRRKCNAHLAMACIFAVSSINLAVTLVGSVQFPFRFPFDPVFILLACFGLYGILSFPGTRMSQVNDI